MLGSLFEIEILILENELKEQYDDVLDDLKLSSNEYKDWKTIHIDRIHLKPEFVGQDKGYPIIKQIFEFALEKHCDVTLFWDTDSGQALEDLWRYKYGFEYEPFSQDNKLIKLVTEIEFDLENSI